MSFMTDEGLRRGMRRRRRMLSWKLASKTEMKTSTQWHLSFRFYTTHIKTYNADIFYLILWAK